MSSKIACWPLGPGRNDINNLKVGCFHKVSLNGSTAQSLVHGPMMGDMPDVVEVLDNINLFTCVAQLWSARLQ